MNAIAHAPTTHERPGWAGPIFFWEVVRQSRRKSLFLWRMCYASVLLAILYLHLGEVVLAQDAPARAELAVEKYIIAQLLAVFVLTPIFVAGSFIEDRQNNTLFLLLTTFLTAREIVVGKLAGRLLNVINVLLTGVPVLALLTLLGGVNVQWLTLYTILTLVLLLLCGITAMGVSSSCKTLGGAIFKAYLANTVLLIAAFYFFYISPPLFLIAIIIGIFLLPRLLNYLSDQVAVEEKKTLLDQDSSKNSATRAANQHIVVPYEPRNAIREWSPIEGQNDPLQYHVAVRYFRVPEVGAWPLCWKDSYFPISNVLNIVVPTGCGLAGFIFFCLLAPLSAAGHANSFCQVCALLVMALVLILACLRAAGCFADERRYGTLASLLGTPVPLTQIILQKWLACFWRCRSLLLLTMAMLVTVFFFYPGRWPLLILLYLTQLACWSLLGVALSVWLSPFQSRAAMGILLFFSFLILPSVLMQAYATMPVAKITPDGLFVDRGPSAQIILLMLCPDTACSLILAEDETKRWPKEMKDSIRIVQQRGYPLTSYNFSNLDQIMRYVFLGSAFLKACYTNAVTALVLFIFSYWSLLRLRQRAAA